jgi:hypothetical protein
MVGFVSIGAATWVAAGPWHTSQETPEWFDTTRSSSTSEWHKTHSWRPAYFFSWFATESMAAAR